MREQPAMKPYVVCDWKEARVPGESGTGVQAIVLGDFDTELEAAEFISALPERLSGRYSLDGPAE